MSRIALVLAAASLVGLEALRTDYVVERSVRVVVESTTELETTSFSMTVDGEPVEHPGGGSGYSVARRAEYIDLVLEVDDDGAPVHVRRSFEELSGSSEFFFGENTRERDAFCPLAGCTLELVREGDDVEVSVVEGETPDDEAALEGHALELALDALLPPDDVDVGDSWDLDAAALVRALGYDVAAALYPDPPPDEGGGEGRRGRRGPGGGGGTRMEFLREAEWEGTATLESLEEDHYGATCALIALELEASGDLPAGEDGDSSGTFDVELEGRLLYALDLRLPVLLEVEGDLIQETEREREMGERSLHMESVVEGPVTYRVELEVLAD